MSDTRVRVEPGLYRNRAEIVIYKTTVPDSTATLVAHFLERWGMVASEVDGEDSAGRQKLRLPTSEELVNRAFDIAEMYMAQAKARGHLVDVPDLNEINKEYDEQLKTKKETERARATG